MAIDNILNATDDSCYNIEDSSTSSDVDSSNIVQPKRNEVDEIKKLSSKDTSRVRRWRFLVTTCLLATAVAIATASYKFLASEQEAAFEEAYLQFSRSVKISALAQQRYIKEGFQSFADAITLYAIRVNATWPFVTIEGFESEARNYRRQTGAEVFDFFVKVTEEQRGKWITYANSHYEAMVKEAHIIQNGSLRRLNQIGYKEFISKPGPRGFNPQDVRPEYFPTWYFSPPPSTYGLINWDYLSVEDYANAAQAVRVLKNQSVVTRVRNYIGVPTAMTAEEHSEMHSMLNNSDSSFPHSFVCHPVHENLNDPDSPIVAILGGGIAWDFALRNLLPEGVRGISAVIRNTCNQSYTFDLDGPNAFFKGEGDLHDRTYSHMEVPISLSFSSHAEFASTPGHCIYSMHVFPSTTFKSTYQSNTPAIFTFIIGLTFAIIILVFFVYDMYVQQRNEKLIVNAAKSSAVVSSLFPGTLRDRVINQSDQNNLRATSRNNGANLKSFLAKGGDMIESSEPLADFFVETTILFADLVGFTAWSSVREPTQVFTLLESVYSAFDKIAMRRGVYKIETVGDCYVAVTGLPEPRKDHAVAMARFARDIIYKMSELTKSLETSLGPGTADLTIRVGIHSGPVTAGVLRGERARFQLFGDTMNTCSRMESSGVAGRVHVSKETAQLLIRAGKESWIYPREEKVYAKGKCW